MHKNRPSSNGAANRPSSNGAARSSVKRSRAELDEGLLRDVLVPAFESKHKAQLLQLFSDPTGVATAVAAFVAKRAKKQESRLPSLAITLIQNLEGECEDAIGDLDCQGDNCGQARYGHRCCCSEEDLLELCCDELDPTKMDSYGEVVKVLIKLCTLFNTSNDVRLLTKLLPGLKEVVQHLEGTEPEGFGVFSEVFEDEYEQLTAIIDSYND